MKKIIYIIVGITLSMLMADLLGALYIALMTPKVTTLFAWGNVLTGYIISVCTVALFIFVKMVENRRI